MTWNPEIMCRLIEPKDVPAVANIFCSAFVSVEDEVRRAEERTGNSNHGAVIALVENQVVGALFFDHKAEGNHRAVYIDQVAVVPHYRRLGIGTELLDWINSEALSTRCEYIFLLVNVENKAAIRCYTKNCFVSRDSEIFAPFSVDPRFVRMEHSLTVNPSMSSPHTATQPSISLKSK